MMYAPIALFVYKRLEHTRQAIRALQNNDLAKISPLIIFSDYARSTFEVDEVLSVRKFCKSVCGFKSVDIVERSHNLGLSKSIISGVTEVLSRYDQIIVIEDDLVVAPYFLNFMNDGLRRYEADERVISIHGYVYPTKNIHAQNYFLRGADCWGWATWKRGWKLFNQDGTTLLKELTARNLLTEFDFNGAYHFSRMLKDQIRGRNDSWAIRWYASAFLENKLTLYPCKSLIQNIGFDGKGSHCAPTNIFDVDLTQDLVEVTDIPVASSAQAFEEMEKFYRDSRRSFLTRLLAKIKMVLIRR
jgi:hypothetical protein